MSTGREDAQRSRPTALDQARIAEEIEFIQTIGNEVSFRRFWREAITDPDPDPEVLAALRSPAIIKRSLAAADTIMESIARDRADPAIRSERGREWVKRSAAAETFIGAERRIMRDMIAEALDAVGQRPGKPNPRKRALERVGQLLARGETITPKLFRQLIAEETALAKQKAKEAAAARKAAGATSPRHR